MINPETEIETWKSEERAEMDALSRAKAKAAIQAALGKVAGGKRAARPLRLRAGAGGPVSIDDFDDETARLLRVQKAAHADMRRLEMWIQKTAGVLREEQLF